MADENKDVRAEEAVKITEAINRAGELEQLAEMIKNNVIEFSIEKNNYRVRQPNYKEKQETKEVKIKKHSELRMNPSYRYEVQLISELAAKGINISDLINKMLVCHQQVEELQLKLAEFGDQKEEDNKIITELKLQIYNLLVEQRNIALEKAEYLSESIESELLALINSYIVYLVLEQKVGDEWKRVYSNYEEFMSSDKEELRNQAGYYTTLLLYKGA